jgi:isochorismate synthase
MALQSFGATLTAAADFLLLGHSHSMAFSGMARGLPAGGVATLADRAARFFAAGDAAASGVTASDEACRILVGAVPYDTMAEDNLFQPLRRLSLFAGAQAGMVRPAAPKAVAKPAVQVLAEPPAAQYREAVAEAVARIGQGAFEKIVLSRSLRLIAQQPHDPAYLLDRLSRDPLVTVFSTPLQRHPDAQARRLIGATPE